MGHIARTANLACNINAARESESKSPKGTPIVLSMDIFPAPEYLQVPDPDFAACSAIQQA